VLFYCVPKIIGLVTDKGCSFNHHVGVEFVYLDEHVAHLAHLLKLMDLSQHLAVVLRQLIQVLVEVSRHRFESLLDGKLQTRLNAREVRVGVEAIEEADINDFVALLAYLLPLLPQSFSVAQHVFGVVSAHGLHTLDCFVVLDDHLLILSFNDS